MAFKIKFTLSRNISAWVFEYFFPYIFGTNIFIEKIWLGQLEMKKYVSAMWAFALPYLFLYGYYF